MSTFGEELRRERKLRRIALREVAEATKINLRYLEALERNDFQHLPGGVFNRGFVRAYAQYIGVDPDGMVNAYLLEEQAQTTQELSNKVEDWFEWLIVDKDADDRFRETMRDREVLVPSWWSSYHPGSSFAGRAGSSQWVSGTNFADAIVTRIEGLAGELRLDDLQVAAFEILSQHTSKLRVGLHEKDAKLRHRFFIQKGKFHFNVRFKHCQMKGLRARLCWIWS